jgi:hypothetical protein
MSERQTPDTQPVQTDPATQPPSWQRLFADLLAVIAVYAPIRFLLFPSVALPKAFHLPADAYESGFVALRALTFPNAIWWFALSAALIGAHFIDVKGNPFFGKLRWNTTETPGIRIALMGLGLPIAWKLTTIDVNVYFDQVHALDRVLIAALYLAMFRTPLAIPWFLGLSAAFFAQFHFPECFHFTWADKAVLYYGMLLIWVAFIVSKVRRLDAAVVPALLLCLFASFYFYPGVTKLVKAGGPLTWLLFNPVYDLFMGAYAHGWWAGADFDILLRVERFLRTFNLASTGFTMCLELGIVSILLHRRLALLFLWSAVAFHAGVLLASGILFWEWWVPEFALLYLLHTRWKSNDVAHIFTNRLRFASPLLIVFALPIFWPYALGWLDSPYTAVYELEVQTGDSEWTPINRADLDPYNLPFTQNRFSFLVEEPIIHMGSYGAITDRDLQIGLMAATSVEELHAALAPFEEVRANADDRAAFENFLQRYFANEAARGGRTSVVPGFLESFHHQYAHAFITRPEPAPPVRRARMRMTEVWFDGEQQHILSDQIVMEIDVPVEAPPRYESPLE